MTNIEVLELDVLPEHLIVIGGGYVGLEFAQAYGVLAAKSPSCNALTNSFPTKIQMSLKSCSGSLPLKASTFLSQRTFFRSKVAPGSKSI